MRMEQRMLLLHLISLSSRDMRHETSWTKRGNGKAASHLQFEFQLSWAFGFFTINGDLAPQFQGHGAIQDACQKPALICIITAPQWSCLFLHKQMWQPRGMALWKSMESLSLVPPSDFSVLMGLINCTCIVQWNIARGKDIDAIWHYEDKDLKWFSIELYDLTDVTAGKPNLHEHVRKCYWWVTVPLQWA